MTQITLAKHGAAVNDRIGPHALWIAFDFEFNNDDAAVFARCTNLIQGFAGGRCFQPSGHTR